MKEHNNDFLTYMELEEALQFGHEVFNYDALLRTSYVFRSSILQRLTKAEVSFTENRFGQVSEFVIWVTDVHSAKHYIDVCKALDSMVEKQNNTARFSF